MKLKHALIIGGVGMAIGGVMMAGSYMSGANLNVAWHDGPKVVKIKHINKTFAGQDIKQLRVTNDNNYVEIKRGTEWRVKMTTINANMSTQLRDGVLTVHATDQDNVMTTMSYDPAVTITVPDGVKLDKLDLTSENGGISVKGLAVTQSLLRNDNGGIRLENVNGDTVKSEAENGATRLQNVTLKSAHITTDNGQVKLNNTTLTEMSDVTAENGQVVLQGVTAPGMAIKTDSGYLTAQGFDLPAGAKDYQTGDQNKALHVQTTNGMIQLKK